MINEFRLDMIPHSVNERIHFIRTREKVVWQSLLSSFHSLGHHDQSVHPQIVALCHKYTSLSFRSILGT